MEKVRENFDDYTKVLDEMLYYNPEDLNRQILEYETEQAQKRGYEQGMEKGIKEGKEEGILEIRKQTIKNMIDNGFEDEIILRCLDISSDELYKIKEQL